MVGISTVGFYTIRVRKGNTMEVNYEYTVITKENSKECNFSKEFWKKHPKLKYFIRTDFEYQNTGKYIGSGGKTIQEAIDCIENGIKSSFGTETSIQMDLNKGMTIIEQIPKEMIVNGKEAKKPIDNFATQREKAQKNECTRKIN